MGANTKSGRTRNRRGLAANAAPGGQPILMLLTFASLTGARTCILNVIDPESGRWPGGVITGGATLQIHPQGSSTMMTLSLVWNAAGNVLEGTLDQDFNGPRNFLVPAWQTTARGTNGEWVSPSLLHVPAL